MGIEEKEGKFIEEVGEIRVVSISKLSFGSRFQMFLKAPV